MTQHNKPNPKGATRYWGDRPMPESKAEFFNAVTTPAPTGDGVVATVRLYGPIDSWGGFWGVSAKDVSAVLDALPDSVEQIILRVNSPGGAVFEAVSIINLLRAHKAQVLAVVDGLAASAASFLAASCDETIMSPGTQMMIHSPSVIDWGNARDLRKTADILDKVESSMIELYTAKAGEQDWTTLLADETWMTAAETVELGLADRVAVIPDAGETATAGEDDDEVIVLVPADPDEDSAEDSTPIIRIAARATGPRSQTPDSTEPGEPSRKENVVAYDDLKAGLCEKLGVTDAAADDETLLAALDEALAEQAEAPIQSAIIGSLPSGVVAIEESQLEQMRADAAAGREAREAQIAAEREATVDAAINDGRIAVARRKHWIEALEADPGAAETLAGLQRGLIPLEAKGHTGGIDQASDEDVAYSKVYSTTTSQEA